MEPPPRVLDPDAARPTTKPLSFPNANGTLKKPRRPPPPPQASADLLYRECLKNHAASLGGHALDGCGEFMPSPAANPSDPSSLKCAACGCHRNFHRRLPDPRRDEGEDEMDGAEDESDDQIDDDDDDDDDGDNEIERERDCDRDRDLQRRRGSDSPPPYFSSAPHMLLALSTAAVAGGVTAAAPTGPAAAAAPRKRFRTKFSPEQKERMQELSERLGWRMQKRDEGLVEEWCRGIGVGKGVFKVWMHNNKHNFVPGSARRGEVGSSSSSGVAVAVAVGGKDVGGGCGVVGNGNGNGNGCGGAGNSAVAVAVAAAAAMNGSSSSS